MDTFIVRVWLPDRPGALGSVASRIGAVGGDVAGIEVIDRGAGRAIDELVVQIPPGRLDLLVREIGEVDGVDVEETRYLEDPNRDTRFRALETAVSIVEVADVTDLANAVAGAVRRDLDAGWCAVAGTNREVVLGSDGAAPSTAWLTSFVQGSTAAAVSDRLDGPDDVAWAVLTATPAAIVVGRSGVAFRPRERRHLVALARLASVRWSELSDRPTGHAPDHGGRGQSVAQSRARSTARSHRA